MTTTAPVSTADRSLAGNDGAGFVTTAVTTARRTLLQFFRTPQTLMQASVQGPLFLLMFRYVFGGAISTGGAVSYVDFLVPGFLVTVIIWTGMGGASGVAEDSDAGVFDRLRSLPVPRTAIIMGRALADTVLVAWGVLVTAIVGFLVGFRFHGSFAAFLFALLLIVFAAFCCTWVFITIGLTAGNAQAAQGMGILVIPFSFISSANVPVQSMPGWMQPFAANQPFSVMINAVRSLMVGGTDTLGIGHSTGYWVVMAIVWSIVILVVFGFLSVRRFSKPS